jgi:hypothetical protein
MIGRSFTDELSVMARVRNDARKKGRGEGLVIGEECRQPLVNGGSLDQCKRNIIIQVKELTEKTSCQGDTLQQHTEYIYY